MDKGDDSDQFHHLRNLHKLSHKIAKPTRQIPPHAPPPDRQEPPHAPPQQQPPVYNINKNDFREVVQKLTGSPAHDRVAQSPPPPPPPKPGHSSRLHRIRPPPLVQISPRPPPMLTCAGAQNPAPAGGGGRPPPMSPLPPFPAVHAAAESPISAYMRFFQSSSTAPPLPPPSPLAFGCLPSPLFSPSGLSGFPVSPVPSPGKRAN